MQWSKSDENIIQELNWKEADSKLLDAEFHDDDNDESPTANDTELEDNLEVEEHQLTKRENERNISSNRNNKKRRYRRVFVLEMADALMGPHLKERINTPTLQNEMKNLIRVGRATEVLRDDLIHGRRKARSFNAEKKKAKGVPRAALGSVIALHNMRT
ncbi:hypothetical protein EVAR_81013_1 [Eumeta japonica]|uniref:Uncharacterized protein n=1 Tax=Eumeta variegata TaxID=151549 RepID=A0A4C1T6G1_EUMVA|nr:hypothetical protein EVAR_81013_1 [Eumeta japonica]